MRNSGKSMGGGVGGIAGGGTGAGAEGEGRRIGSLRRMGRRRKKKRHKEIGKFAVVQGKTSCYVKTVSK